MNATNQAALSALRTLLAFAAGIFVTKGWLSADQATELVGAAVVLVPLLWGIAQKFQAETSAQVRETVAARTSPMAGMVASPVAKSASAIFGNSQPALALLFVCFLAVSLSACATNGQTAGGGAATADPIKQLADFTIADLQAADMDATANGDVLAHACYPALVTFIQSLPSGSGTTVKGAFGAFQKARDLRNASSAGVPLYLTQGCGGLYAQVHGDLLKFLAGAGFVANPLLP